MAFEYGFYNSINGDRKYNALDFGKVFDGVIRDGVFADIGDKMFVTRGVGSFEILVGTGKAWFDHTWNLNTSPMLFTLSGSHPVLTRYDAVVLEVNETQDVYGRVNEIKVIEGTPSSNPVKPTLLNTDNLHQHPLAYVKINPEATEVTAQDIEIVVGQTDCPFVTSILQQTDITELFANWNGQFNTWFDNLKAQLTDNVVTNLQNQIDNCLKVTDIATPEDIANGTEGKIVTSEYVAPLTHKIGDIVYSTRNLEEESDGIWMACDQRTIDTNAYPNIPKELLFWPMPELVFSYIVSSSTENIADGDNAQYNRYLGRLYDISTDNYIYINGLTHIYQSNTSVAKDSFLIYSISEKKIYPVHDKAPYTYWNLVRVGDNKIIPITNGSRNTFDNRLNIISTTGLPIEVSTLLNNSHGYITRLGPSSFFIVSLQSTSEAYPKGFYKTTDGFATIQQVTTTTSIVDSQMTYNLFKQLDADLLTGSLYYSPFYPIQKSPDNTIIVTFSGINSSISYNASSETATRTNIKNALPIIFETNQALTTISSRILGGQGLEDWIYSQFNSSITTMTVNKNIPINGEYYLLLLNFNSATYYVAVDIKTNEFFVNHIEKYTNGYINTINDIFYDRRRKQLIMACDSGLVNHTKIDFLLKSIDINIVQFGGFKLFSDRVYDNKMIPINYMPNSVAIHIGGGSNITSMVEKRSHDRGYDLYFDHELILIDNETSELSGFEALNIFGICGNIKYNNYSNIYFNINSSVNNEDRSNGVYSSNLVEVNGDIYIPRQKFLYKFPKNKRQMPYIKYGFMKVLDD